LAQTIIGLGGLLSDPSCCVLRDGRIASAVEQAKVSRHDRPGAFPDEAFQFALEEAGIKLEAIDCVAIARPFAPTSESRGLWELQARFPNAEIAVVEHHQAHAASAYYCSPFQSATVLSMDRAGDYRSAALYRGQGNQLTPVREMYFPDSLGDLFNRVTDLLGFEPRADEHKVQWLSVSGKPNYLPVFQKMLRQNGSGWPRFDRSYFDADRLTHGGFSAQFFEECGLSSSQPLTAGAKADLARSLQVAVEEAAAAMLGSAENVCLAGGLTLNTFLVRSLEDRFENVFVQPVGGNAGTCLGAALHVWHNFYNQTARIPLETLCLGPSFSLERTKQALENCKLRFQFLPTQGDLIQTAVRALNDYKIVAWMQGRMEFGPRALGNRSILASPLNPYSTENLNVYIKHRENFRKFAASVPQELADKYFEVKPNAHYLATVSRVRPKYRERFAAAILGDDYVRVHTVRREENPLYHALLLAAGKSTGLPALYNTSFNLFGDPLVCTPRDAVRSFYSSGIDALFAGHFYLEK
jgi:carbamoyltransferase